MPVERTRAPPSTAVGLALLAVMTVTLSAGAAFWPRWPQTPRPAAPVCAAPIEVVGDGRARLGCADEPAWRGFALAAGDRVAEGDRARAPGGMSAAMRLAVGVPLDLNRASAAELELLPGIGGVLSAAIVADRLARGPFTSVDDLARVRGIGPRTVERLRRWVTVGGE